MIKNKIVILLLLIYIFFISCFNKKPEIYTTKIKLKRNKTIKVQANSNKEFYWPYLFYFPKELLNNKNEIRILVIPNNTGATDDNFYIHEKDAVKKFKYAIEKIKLSDTILLMSIFPRFKTKMGGWKYYTHALDKITFEINKVKKPVIKIEQKSSKLKSNSTITYHFEDIYVIQDQNLYRCYAGDFNPLNSFTKINELELNFIFFHNFDFTKPFHLIEDFMNNEIPVGGFIFKNVNLDNNGIIKNNIALNDDNMKITNLFYADDNNFKQIWNIKGEKIKINEKEKLIRLDLQLIAMINDLKNKMKQHHNINIKDKIYMFGFSASGMFCDRFTYLHPNLVEKAVIGAPGGMPMSPLEQLNGKKLDYPIGVNNLSSLTGKSFNKDAFQEVHRFIFIGENDTNDSVIYRDSFSIDEEKLIFSLFGSKPVERHKKIEAIFKTLHYNKTQFKTFQKEGHKINKKIFIEINNFLKN